jgi:hypothetical protein
MALGNAYFGQTCGNQLKITFANVTHSSKGKHQQWHSPIAKFTS